MSFIIGKKVSMTQVFSENGEVFPVTVVKVAPMVVTQIKTGAADGYEAVQIGYGAKAERKVKKPQKGHTKNLGNFEGFVEFKPADVSKFKVGDKIGMADFKVNGKITISGVSKGKGFQGVVKRHGFHGGSRTHGQKHSEREPGAIGGGGRGGGRVIKGMKMAGRMGGERVTVKNLKVVAVQPEDNLMLIGGAVPGRRGTVVEIRG